MRLIIRKSKQKERKIKWAIANSKYNAGIDHDRTETMIFNFLFEPYSEQNRIMIKNTLRRGLGKEEKWIKQMVKVAAHNLLQMSLAYT